MVNGRISGMRQDTTLLADSPFLGKYYTFAFSAETTRYSGYHNDEGQYQLEEVKMQSGYGYLTVKTDANGGAKATGIFTGKANVYFDYPKPTSASLPYSGVMIYDGEGGYVGFGSAVHTYKYSYQDDSGRAKSDTTKVTLPVSLTPSNP